MRVGDLVGQRFGRLVPLRYTGRWAWECLCDCGNRTVATTSNLRRGTHKSCGCLRQDFGKRAIHGHARRGGRHPLYARWHRMRQRCRDPKDPSYPYYGGRGIMVCERWGDFTAFLADMGMPPAAGYELDRIDNDAHYEPGNVRWSTKQAQMANRQRGQGWPSHVRWHVNRGLVKPSCPYCTEEKS
jgi:hypothetical protein